MKDTTVAKTLVECDSTLIEIAKRYLNKAIDHVSLIDIDDIEMAPATDPPASKKLKTIDSSINRKEKYSNTYRNHIHAVMSLLDILEIGHKDQQLSLEFCIKLAELNTKYFFWSTMESGRLRLNCDCISSLSHPSNTNIYFNCSLFPINRNDITHNRCGSGMYDVKSSM